MEYEAITDSDILDGLSVRYLKIFGLWKVINDYRKTGKKNLMLKLQVIMTSLITIPSILLQFLSFVFIDVDIEKATILNLHSFVSLQVLTKLLVFWLNIDSLCRLYNLMTKSFLNKTMPDTKRKTVKNIYCKICKRTNIICYGSLFLVLFISSFLVFNPVISVDYILYHTGNMFEVTTGRKKISTGWYPLPMDESPCYEIVFFYESVLIYWGGALLVVFMCLYYQLLMCLYAQFVVLVSHVSTLRIESIHKGNNTNVVRNLELYTKLYRILQDHQKLLSFTDELRSVFNPLVTMLLGMAILVMIISVVQFFFSRTDPIFLLRSLMFLVFQTIEVSLFCYGSSLIETASSDLQFAVYSSDWYKADVKFRKAAQMMMIRARKREILTAIRMYPVNAETIVSIFQFTYTVAALMSRLSE